MDSSPGAVPAANAATERGATPGAPGGGPPRQPLAALAFAALGVVYGDIGTSPLYALRACFGPQGVEPTPANVYGVLSLVFWALVLVISVWYLWFILRADNRGEGGILALMALATRASLQSQRRRAVLVLLGLFGAALLYGDGIITPAISVLGAMEGLEQATPALRPYVVPLSVAVLLGLFLVQRRGTAGVAKLFSPVTLLWFLSIGLLGLLQLAAAPGVLAAVSPVHAVRFFAANGLQGFLVLGFVFLVVTGGEALYADLGHFGRRPMRAAWFTVALPGLLLNYFGQGALLLSEPGAAENPFYRLVPEALLYPMIGLATAAAVVASQAVISGSFSLSHQALQLDYVPRMTVVHTSRETAGQIFVPAVNRALMVFTIGLVLTFQSAESLAAAYGIAVSATMAITSTLFITVAVTRMGWSLPRALLLGGLFLAIDLSFFGANVVKILQGGWFPVLIAGGVFLLMSTWRAGRATLQQMGQRASLPLDLLLQDLKRRKVARVPGTAVFMNNAGVGTAPPVLLHHLKHNKMLHERVVMLSMLTEEVPAVPEDERVETKELEEGFYQVVARYGFMETPNAPYALSLSEPLRDFLTPAETTYYLGRQTLIPAGRSKLPRWRARVFLILARNALRATTYFGIPPNRVVELGAQVQL